MVFNSQNIVYDTEIRTLATNSTHFIHLQKLVTRKLKSVLHKKRFWRETIREARQSQFILT